MILPISKLDFPPIHKIGLAEAIYSKNFPVITPRDISLELNNKSNRSVFFVSLKLYILKYDLLN